MLDFSRLHYVVFVTFDIYSHIQVMKRSHPNWSERQLRCCRYWQGKARACLRYECNRLLRIVKGMEIVYTPEAFGANVTRTMEQHGLILQWPPRDRVYLVALAGFRRNEEVKK